MTKNTKPKTNVSDWSIGISNNSIERSLNPKLKKPKVKPSKLIIPTKNKLNNKRSEAIIKAKRDIILQVSSNDISKQLNKTKKFKDNQPNENKISKYTDGYTKKKSIRNPLPLSAPKRNARGSIITESDNELSDNLIVLPQSTDAPISNVEIDDTLNLSLGLHMTLRKRKSFTQSTKADIPKKKIRGYVDKDLNVLTTISTEDSLNITSNFATQMDQEKELFTNGENEKEQSNIIMPEELNEKISEELEEVEEVDNNENRDINKDSVAEEFEVEEPIINEDNIICDGNISHRQSLECDISMDRRDEDEHHQELQDDNSDSLHALPDMDECISTEVEEIAQVVDQSITSISTPYNIEDRMNGTFINDSSDSLQGLTDMGECISAEVEEIAQDVNQSISSIPNLDNIDDRLNSTFVNDTSDVIPDLHQSVDNHEIVNNEYSLVENSKNISHTSSKIEIRHTSKIPLFKHSGVKTTGITVDLSHGYHNSNQGKLSFLEYTDRSVNMTNCSKKTIDIDESLVSSDVSRQELSEGNPSTAKESSQGHSFTVELFADTKDKEMSKVSHQGKPTLTVPIYLKKNDNLADSQNSSFMIEIDSSCGLDDVSSSKHTINHIQNDEDHNKVEISTDGLRNISENNISNLANNVDIDQSTEKITHYNLRNSIRKDRSTKDAGDSKNFSTKRAPSTYFVELHSIDQAPMNSKSSRQSVNLDQTSQSSYHETGIPCPDSLHRAAHDSDDDESFDGVRARNIYSSSHTNNSADKSRLTVASTCNSEIPRPDSIHQKNRYSENSSFDESLHSVVVKDIPSSSRPPSEVAALPTTTSSYSCNIGISLPDSAYQFNDSLESPSMDGVVRKDMTLLNNTMSESAVTNHRLTTSRQKSKRTHINDIEKSSSDPAIRSRSIRSIKMTKNIAKLSSANKIAKKDIPCPQSFVNNDHPTEESESVNNASAKPRPYSFRNTTLNSINRSHIADSSVREAISVLTSNRSYLESTRIMDGRRGFQLNMTMSPIVLNGRETVLENNDESFDPDDVDLSDEEDDDSEDENDSRSNVPAVLASPLHHKIDPTAKLCISNDYSVIEEDGDENSEEDFKEYEEDEKAGEVYEESEEEDEKAGEDYEEEEENADLTNEFVAEREGISFNPIEEELNYLSPVTPAPKNVTYIDLVDKDNDVEGGADTTIMEQSTMCYDKSYINPQDPRLTQYGIVRLPGKRTRAITSGMYHKVVYEYSVEDKAFFISHRAVASSPTTIRRRNDAEKAARERRRRRHQKNIERPKKVALRECNTSEDGMNVYISSSDSIVQQKVIFTKGEIDARYGSRKARDKKHTIGGNTETNMMSNSKTDTVLQLISTKKTSPDHVMVVVDKCKIALSHGQYLVVPKNVPFFVYNPHKKAVDVLDTR